ncbi:hypothetical protein FCULG_00012190, partial [Fusarium culmorum]
QTLKMSEHLTPWSPVTKVTKKVKIDDLEISFKRTVRVPDNDDTNNLPPDAGSFPLYKVDDYAETLPLSMAQKGGLFIPMYQREAMWINFESKCLYAIKVFVGGINAVSGEPSVEDAATSLRRRNLILQDRSVQDYIVTPDGLILADYKIEDGSTLHMVQRLRDGGGGPRPQKEMNVAAGGLIKQGIFRIPKNDYKKSVPVTFNVQVLNSAGFEQVTGKKLPPSPITAKSYADCSYPFYSIYEEPTTISGVFDGLRSVAQIDQTSEDSLPADMPVMDVDARQVRPRVNIGAVGILDPHGSGQELEFE